MRAGLILSRLTPMIGVAAIIVGRAAPAPAALIFDNGPAIYPYGIDLSAAQEAEDFVLNTSTFVRGVRLWTTEYYPFRLSALPFDGHIDYWIHADDAGKPGAVLATGLATSISRTHLGIDNFGPGPFHRYEVSFGLDQPFSAAAGERYFLALHFLDHYVFDEGFGWVSASGPIYGAPSLLNGAPSHRRPFGVGPWIDNSTGLEGIFGAGHLAFQLFDSIVPEPGGTVSAVVACIAAIPYARRGPRI